ncbi:uncharacterized protein LOC106179765 isoform X1 [Lingula anatina]|uniref:Uncharacterized protein LOC106179765 isoform X1 n=1 Tax=Lingula anatina TaxID=7574 RepID=A0A1S3K942_LINAN|nr:uncharacterized protein LOC106179765 isoform X1 [Lingula anatina]|eukprot:XP_013418964.1 uncharacterized protein LOC106179765 isoform X1 [Lingula anatina]
MYAKLLIVVCLAALGASPVCCQTNSTATGSTSTQDVSSSAVQTTQAIPSQSSQPGDASPVDTSMTTSSESSSVQASTDIPSSSSVGQQSTHPMTSLTSSVTDKSTITMPSSNSVGATASSSSTTSQLTTQTMTSLASSMSVETTQAMSSSESPDPSSLPSTALSSVAYSTTALVSASEMPSTSTSMNPGQSESESMSMSTSTAASPTASQSPTQTKSTPKPATPTKSPNKDAKEKGAIKVQVSNYNEEKFKTTIANEAVTYCEDPKNNCNHTGLTADKIVILSVVGEGAAKTVEFYIEGSSENNVALTSAQLKDMIITSEKLKADMISVLPAPTPTEAAAPLEGWVIAVIATGAFLLVLISITVIKALRERNSKKKEGFHMASFEIGPSELPQNGMQGPDVDERGTEAHHYTNTSTFSEGRVNDGQSASTVNEVNDSKTNDAHPGGIDNIGYSEVRTSL